MGSCYLPRPPPGRVEAHGPAVIRECPSGAGLSHAAPFHLLWDGRSTPSMVPTGRWPIARLRLGDCFLSTWKNRVQWEKPAVESSASHDGQEHFLAQVPRVRPQKARPRRKRASDTTRLSRRPARCSWCPVRADRPGPGLQPGTTRPESAPASCGLLTNCAS